MSRKRSSDEVEVKPEELNDKDLKLKQFKRQRPNEMLLLDAINSICQMKEKEESAQKETQKVISSLTDVMKSLDQAHQTIINQTKEIKTLRLDIINLTKVAHRQNQFLESFRPEYSLKPPLIPPANYYTDWGQTDMTKEFVVPPLILESDQDYLFNQEIINDHDNWMEDLP